MNILHVTPYFAPAWTFGGVCRAVTDLARAQAAAGHGVRVLTTDALTRSARTPFGDETIDGVAVRRLRNRSLAARARFNLSTPAGFARALERELAAPVDVIHCHEVRTPETVIVTRRACRRGGAPVVVSPHGTLTYSTGRSFAKRAWDLMFARRVLSGVDAIIALTDDEAAEVRGAAPRHRVHFPDGRIAVVPNGVDAEAFCVKPAKAEARARWRLGDGPVVLFMGRLDGRKGVLFLAEAFADAAAAVPSARLLIAGPDEGAGAALRSLVARLGIVGRVVLTGFVEAADRLAAFAAADLFALPAVGEGFPVAALEAMACGVPAILSPECHFDAAADAGAAMIIPLERLRWTEALCHLLGAPESRRQMGAHARALVSERYSLPQIVRRMDAVYAMAIDWRRRRR